MIHFLVYLAKKREENFRQLFTVSFSVFCLNMDLDHAMSRIIGTVHVL